MRLMMYRLFIFAFVVAGLGSAQEQVPDGGAATHAVPRTTSTSREPNASRDYTLGSEDLLSIRVLNADEIASTPYAVDLLGNLDLPRVGTIHVAGLTVEQVQAELTKRFSEYLQRPMVTVAVAEFRSQPVLVLGAVGQPGVHQIRGRKTLFEVISEAGGLKPDAGNSINITRRKEWGPIPLPNAAPDASGQFSIAEVSVHSLMTAQDPEGNIPVKPDDVITIPKAELVYVIGSVTKPGGFALSERASISVLQALSMAEGLQRTAGSSNAKILRVTAGSNRRTDIPVNIQKILAGKRPDMPLLANDILFIPNSAAKSASLRALDALIQTGTGVMIYAHPY